MSSNTSIHPPDTEQRPRRVSLADRIALRVGLALIIWSRRTNRAVEPVDHRRFLAHQRAVEEQRDLWAAVGLQLNRWR